QTCALPIFGDAFGLIGIGPRQEDAELFAAEAADDVGGAQHRLDGGGDGDQRLAAAVVAIAVVDRLEVVGVDDEQCTGGSLGARMDVLEVGVDQGGKGG